MKLLKLCGATSHAMQCCVTTDSAQDMYNMECSIQYMPCLAVTVLLSLLLNGPFEQEQYCCSNKKTHFLHQAFITKVGAALLQTCAS